MQYATEIKTLLGDSSWGFRKFNWRDTIKSQFELAVRADKPGRLSSLALSTSQATWITKIRLSCHNTLSANTKPLSGRAKGRGPTLPSLCLLHFLPFPHHLPAALPPRASPGSVLFPTALLAEDRQLSASPAAHLVSSWKFSLPGSSKGLPVICLASTPIPVTPFSERSDYLAAGPAVVSGWIPNRFSEAKPITHYKLQPPSNAAPSKHSCQAFPLRALLFSALLISASYWELTPSFSPAHKPQVSLSHSLAGN